MRTRDEGCRFPGCTNTRFIDGHHVKHWADGGETSLDNLVQLCRHHHRLVHEGGFACERMPDGRFEFRSPAGQGLEPPRPRIDIGRKLEDWLYLDDPDTAIDAQTCVPLWRGERIDWGLAVGALFESARC